MTERTLTPKEVEALKRQLAETFRAAQREAVKAALAKPTKGKRQ